MMSKSKRKIVYITISTMVIFFILLSIFQFITSLRGEIAIKWGVILPRSYEIVYRADTGPSPFGDGVFYYELYYENGIKDSFLGDFSTVEDVEFEEKVIVAMGYIDISSTQMIDFNETYYWKEITYIPSGGPNVVTKALYMIYQPDKNCLYIVRFKI